MKSNIKFIIGLSLTIIALVAIGFASIPFQKTPLAGASISNDSGGYYSTTTPYAGQINGVSGVVLLKGSTTPRSGILGSVVITGGPKSGTMSLYDATTSNVNLRTGNLATSSITLADFPAGVATTTYVFDTTFSTGLLLVTSGSAATGTITWK